MTGRRIGESVRAITRGTKLVRVVRAAAAKSSARTRQDLARARNDLTETLRDASSAGVASAALAARIAPGMLAGVADALTRKR